MRGLVINLGVSLARKVLEHVYEVVFRGVLHILEAHGRLFVRIEVSNGNRSCRSRHIVGRMSRDFVFISLRGSRGGYSIRKGALFNLNDVGIEDNLVSSVVEIVILCGDLVDLNGAELRNNGDALIDDRGGSYLGVSTLNDPLLEHLAGNEWIFWHRANGLACCAVVLGQLLCHSAIVVEGDKPYEEVILKLGLEGKIGGYLFSPIVLCFANIPAKESLAFDNWTVCKHKSLS